MKLFKEKINPYVLKENKQNLLNFAEGLFFYKKKLIWKKEN